MYLRTSQTLQIYSQTPFNELFLNLCYSCVQSLSVWQPGGAATGKFTLIQHSEV